MIRGLLYEKSMLHASSTILRWTAHDGRECAFTPVV